MSTVSDLLSDFGLTLDDDLDIDDEMSLEWELMQSDDSDSDYDSYVSSAESLELLTSINDNLTNINLLLGFLVTVGFAVLIVYIIIRPVFEFLR